MRNAVKSLRSEAGTGAALSDGGGGGGGGTAPPLGTAVHRDEGGPRWGAAWGGREEHSTSAKPRAPSFVAREGGLRGCGDGREKTGRRWFRFGGEVSSRRGAICLSNPTDLVVVLGWARRAEGHWVPGGVPGGSSSLGASGPSWLLESRGPRCPRSRRFGGIPVLDQPLTEPGEPLAAALVGVATDQPLTEPGELPRHSSKGSPSSHVLLRTPRPESRTAPSRAPR